MDHAADAVDQRRWSIRSSSILNGVGNRVLQGVRRSPAGRRTPEQYYTPEELQLIVQESEELGAIRAESGQMLQELFEFGDLTAGRSDGAARAHHRDSARQHAREGPRGARPDAAHAVPDLRAATSITSSA